MPEGKRAGVTGPLFTGRGVLYNVCTILPSHTVIIIHYNCEEIIFCNSTLRTRLVRLAEDLYWCSDPILYSNRILLCEKSANLYVISTRVLL
jgi:hypothetical protein